MSIIKTILINTDKPYNLYLGNNILKDTGILCSKLFSPCKVLIITDNIVSELYLNETTASLKNNGFECYQFIFEHGESSKNIETLNNILEFLAENNFIRTDFIAALGGGVVGDIAGFCSAIYLRGIRFIGIPTTLLSQVDSSVGGKTAIDLKAGKNLAGTFHQPKMVICDIDTLKTLPEKEFSQGMAEIIKYSIVFDEDLFNKISSDDYNLNYVIEKCICLKRDIVIEDEFDNGNRQLLNFGHTLAHAIERLSGYQTPHGYAVAIGMFMFTKAAYKLGICDTDLIPALTNIFEKYNLPISCEYSSKELFETTLRDKKRSGNNIKLVLPQKLGHCILHDMKISELLDFIDLGEKA